MKLIVGCHRFLEIFLPKVRGVGLQPIPEHRVEHASLLVNPAPLRFDTKLSELIEMKITFCVFARRGLPGAAFVYLMVSE